LGERNWRNAARNRDSWQKLLKKALAQKGCCADDDDDDDDDQRVTAFLFPTLMFSVKSGHSADVIFFSLS